MTAEFLARQRKISRLDQDQFALRSHQRAAAAHRAGDLARERIPIMGHDSDGAAILVNYDEVVRADTDLDALSKLRPAFDPQRGTVTAGNSSAISDGAACILLASRSKAQKLGLKPMARVVSMAAVGLDPAIMGYGPVPAVQKSLQKARMSVHDLELFELNEAFAAQSLPVLQDLGLLDDFESKVNIRGGAIALGHPLGCSGSRIIATLVHAMVEQDKNVGAAAMCIGLGQGIATVLERC